MDVKIRLIEDLVTEPKRLVDGIFFDGLDVLRCYEGKYHFSFKDRPPIMLNPGELLVTYPRHTVTIDACGERNRLVYGIFEGKDVERYFDSLGFFDCIKGRTEAHYETIMELKDKCTKMRGGVIMCIYRACQIF